MFSARALIPARSARSKGSSPSRLTWSKKPRSRMSALWARATDGETRVGGQRAAPGGGPLGVHQREHLTLGARVGRGGGGSRRRRSGRFLEHRRRAPPRPPAPAPGRPRLGAGAAASAGAGTGRRGGGGRRDAANTSVDGTATFGRGRARTGEGGRGDRPAVAAHDDRGVAVRRPRPRSSTRRTRTPPEARRCRRRRRGPTSTSAVRTVLTSAPSARRPLRCRRLRRVGRRNRLSGAGQPAGTAGDARDCGARRNLTRVWITIRYRDETNGARKVTVSLREESHFPGSERPRGGCRPAIGSRGPPSTRHHGGVSPTRLPRGVRRR